MRRRHTGARRHGVVLTVGAVLAILCPAEPGHAQKTQRESSSPALEAEARSLFHAGRAAFRQGRYEAALEHFEEAYELSSRPELLYNIGTVADRLRRDRKAIDAFERYLEQMPDAPNRAEVESRLRVLRNATRGGASTGRDGASRDAQVPPPGPGYRESPGGSQGAASSRAASRGYRHRGFYFRFALGLGFTGGRRQAGPGDLAIRGGGPQLDIAIGGAVNENFIIHGQLFGDLAASPTVERDGEGLQADSFSVAGLGIGITYYFMPANVYLSPALTVSGANIDAADAMGEIELRTDAGIGLRMQVGKEWWVAEEWGLGVAGQLSFHRIPEQGGGAHLDAGSFGVLFSVSYN